MSQPPGRVERNAYPSAELMDHRQFRHRFSVALLTLQLVVAKLQNTSDPQVGDLARSQKENRETLNGYPIDLADDHSAIGTIHELISLQSPVNLEVAGRSIGVFPGRAFL
jgi:hypothetical protein